MTNPYPFFGYSATTLDYALFRTIPGVFDDNTKLQYTNMLDAQLDAVYSALKVLGFEDVEIVIAETGWSSVGHPAQFSVDPKTASEYNGNLIRHVTSGVGTPLMPNRTFDTYIFALFDENLKPGPTCDRNFGLFWPNMTPVYQVPTMRNNVDVIVNELFMYVFLMLELENTLRCATGLQVMVLDPGCVVCARAWKLRSGLELDPKISNFKLWVVNLIHLSQDVFSLSMDLAFSSVTSSILRKFSVFFIWVWRLKFYARGFFKLAHDFSHFSLEYEQGFHLKQLGCSSSRHAYIMDKTNKVCAKDEERPLRITRARARALRGIPPYARPKNDPKNVLRANAKRTAISENKTSVVVPAVIQCKGRTVLTDVTNKCAPSQDKFTKASKFQAKGVLTKKSTKLASGVSSEVSSSQEDVRGAKLAGELSATWMVESNDSIRGGVTADTTLSMQNSVTCDELQSSRNKGIDVICEKLGASDSLTILDIDSEIKDPQVWSSYAPDIYNTIRVTELQRKPLTNYMDKLQKDINPSMRGILVDWLVEVSEEYKLVPDTLYLTVNLIDRYLSTRFIQKQRLQLLGVTCMLIASKYEEMCAPRVEEFCFITDNTYTKEEVLKMEREVLNLVHFQLSVPTIKTFLRRFIQAAQSSYKSPCVELEFLANYLAELALVEYSFFQFLPSLIAASAVFLARWTLNESEHPWNPTLEYYTNYIASELKTVVLALQDLQLNSKGCPLNAVREKYKQHKFNCVANLSPKPVQSLFQDQV
ncbi:hypothetical protein VNO78_00971 [Psophocarpus tetragonolobus]|uniref:glucan endo-1,3-beta-D-glucosidase n=1 Tax=Psophocarpus tetragonolobus TaxID=3891 RepID=A0AAN9T122_PSOTE